jgi:hypothetical protein
MKTKPRENNFSSTLRNVFRRRARRHDPMLVLNMSTFNFTDGMESHVFKTGIRAVLSLTNRG